MKAFGSENGRRGKPDNGNNGEWLIEGRDGYDRPRSTKKRARQEVKKAIRQAAQA